MLNLSTMRTNHQRTGISSEDWGRWSSETSPEQMLEYAQPRPNQRCYWPVV